MKLHIFNPEHDIALAYGAEYLTLPHAIQEFKMNLGYLPALWASDGDCVLVDDVPYAIKALDKTHRAHADVVFVGPEELHEINFSEIEPWGWDSCLRTTLAKSGVIVNGENIHDVVNDRVLYNIRDLSNRKHTSEVLNFIRNSLGEYVCGESFYITQLDEIFKFTDKYGRVVIKAPWSSSGRGIRYISHTDNCISILGWAKNIIKCQGGLCVEPYYNKIKDFAMEFYAHDDGSISYCGLSVFNTERSTYVGNIIAPEAYKIELISKYVSKDLLMCIKESIKDCLSLKYRGLYKGPFGVDMMIVACDTGGFLLHPCIEINLRRTMGHVANAICSDDKSFAELMHIKHDVNYLLQFEPLDKSFIKVI